MTTPARVEAERLFAAFQAQGAQPIAADILQPADILLDLYGEDIRARAYVTDDPVRGEMMLRPDFTVPVVQAHMAHGAEPARYTYVGEVFRKQDALSPRAAEYLQVGYEVFDRTAPEAADAHVFALFARLLAPLSLRASTGDPGLVLAAIRGLTTTPARKAALLRHVWRPRRFRALLDRFAGRTPVADTREALLAHLGTAHPEALIAGAGSFMGARTKAEITSRAYALQDEAQVPPLPAAEARNLDRLMALRGTALEAEAALQDIATNMPAIAEAVARFSRRLAALRSEGIDPAILPFETLAMRSTLEYYDGFVFSFHAADASLPPVATGGRYDALTAVLGRGRSIPAVGGVIRPALVADLEGQV